MKLLVDTKDDITNNEISDIFKHFECNINNDLTDEITTLYNIVKNTEIYCNFDLDEITNIFNKFDNKLDSKIIEYNEHNKNFTINENEKFYICRQNEDILYRVVDVRKLGEFGECINYTVEMFKGELIDTIEDDGELYSIIEFKEDILDVETRPSWRYLDNKYSIDFNTDLISYKYKDFDFNKPLKIKVPAYEDEDENE